MDNMDELKQQVKDLEKQVKDLENKFKNAEFLQREFSGRKVFGREVQFMRPVYDKNGTKVIN